MRPQTETWLELAKNDLDFARDILKNKKRQYYAAHFCHQAIEKILKAIVQEKTGTTPPKVHNFNILCEAAGLVLPPDIKDILLSLSPHYLGTRYPEDISKLYQKYSLKYVQDIFKRTEELFKWLEGVLI